MIGVDLKHIAIYKYYKKRRSREKVTEPTIDSSGVTFLCNREVIWEHNTDLEYTITMLSKRRQHKSLQNSKRDS